MHCPLPTAYPPKIRRRTVIVLRLALVIDLPALRDDRSRHAPTLTTERQSTHTYSVLRPILLANLTETASMTAFTPVNRP